jgi:hypothetical protein
VTSEPRAALVLAVLLTAATACTANASADREKASSPPVGVRLDLQAIDGGGCCVVTTVNPRDDAVTVICFVYVLDDAGRLLATRWVPPLPPGHRRSSGFSAPPGRFEQGVYEIPLQLPEQRYRTTCRPAAWHGGAPI